MNSRRIFKGRLLLALMAVCLACACSLSPERMGAADRIVADSRAWQPVDGEARPLGAPGRLDVPPLAGNRHRAVLIDQGSDALAMRIHLIRSARERIDMMSYIFAADDSGLLLLDELLAAAHRGVRVRLMVDSLFSLDNPDLLAALARSSPQFELRLYNALFDRALLGRARFAAAIFCCLRRLNHRMHHKLLAIDGRHALLGGRNVADRYFDLDTRMNFLDMEVLVSGAEVNEMIEDFERFWRHELSRPAWHTHEVAARLIDGQAGAAPELAPGSRAAYALAMAEDPDWLERLLADSGYLVEHLKYFSDPPGLAQRGESAAHSTASLRELMASSRHRLTIQTPYFVLDRGFERALKSLAEGVEITVSTNSLAATDAWPVYAISRRQRHRMIEEFGLRLHEVKPFPADIERLVRRYPKLVADKAAGIESTSSGDPAPATRDMPGPRTSLHAKLVIADGERAAITSHNLDPRSQTYNTENGLLIEDAAFARALEQYVELLVRPRNSWVVAARRPGPPVLGQINRGLARLSRRLPTLDLWPWYLTENYELPAYGPTPSPDEAGFRSIARPVGMSPEVVHGPRRLLTSIVSRMFGFTTPLM